MRDYRAELESGGCTDGHGCNTAKVCLCGLIEDAADDIASLTAENERLREALKPFSRAAGFHAIEVQADDNLHVLVKVAPGLSGALTVRDFRRARAALSNHSEYTPITVSHKTRPEWRPDPKTVEVAAEIAAVWRISKLNNGDLTDSQLNDFLNEIGPNIAATIRSLLSHPSALEK
jgi:hypothetical protein